LIPGAATFTALDRPDEVAAAIAAFVAAGSQGRIGAAPPSGETADPDHLVSLPQ
jgi:hypothetical protein